MITIKNIGCEGFRAFRDTQQTQDLSPRGFFGIRGQNLTTGGSSGAGKSSVAHLLAYLLGYSPFPASKQQSSLTKKPLQTWCTLESPEGTVVLRRGKETSIQVGDEAEISGSVTKVNERLERLFGVGSDLLRSLTYRPQRKPGLFLSLADADKKHFLSKVLGLEAVRKQVQDSVKLVSAANDLVGKREAAQVALQSVSMGEPHLVVSDNCTVQNTSYSRTEVEEVQGRLALDLALHKKDLEAIIEVEREFRESERVRSTAAKEAIAQRCRDFDLELNKQMLALVEPGDCRQSPEYEQLKSALAFAETRISDFRNHQGELMAEIGEEKKRLRVLEAKLTEKSGAELRLRQLRERADSIRRQECPTCTQVWIQGDLKSCLLDIEIAEDTMQAFAEIYFTAEEHRNNILGIEIKIQDREELQGFQTARENILTDIRSFDTRYAEELSAFKVTKAELSQNLGNQSNAFRQQASADQVNMYAEVQARLDEYQAKIEIARTQVGNTEYKIRACSESLTVLDSKNAAARKAYGDQVCQYDKFRTEFEAAHISLIEAKTGRDLETDYVWMIKGFLGGIFAEILDEISDEANALLQGLPNVATTTISFSTEKEKTDGSFDASIVPVITRGGVTMDLEANLSGGQLASVELAVDLAVSKVVQRRTGSAPGWLVLDEAFSGMDAVVIESCLSLLSKAGADLQIFVIDHSAEVRDYFTQVITVVSENDVSRIESNG